jgi:hypothetical protein
MATGVHGWGDPTNELWEMNVMGYRRVGDRLRVNFKVYENPPLVRIPSILPVHDSPLTGEG